VFRLPKSGGQAVVVGVVPCLATRLALAGGRTYVSGGRAPTACPVFTAPSASAHARVIAFVPGDHLHLLAVDRESAYVTIDRKLSRVSMANGQRDEPPPGAADVLSTTPKESVPVGLKSIDGLDLVAARGERVYYSIAPRKRPFAGDFGPPASAVFRHGLPSLKLADDQDGVSDLTAGRDGVYWRQLHGLRWADDSGTLRAIDCVNAFDATGLVEANGRIYWTDGHAGALLAYPP
jgi:hypothetical protein